MLKKILIDSFGLVKNIIVNPARMFEEIENGEYRFSVYLLFIASSLFTFLKSLNKEKLNINFYENESINEIFSFFSIPQIRWLVALISFVLLILLISIFCKVVLRRYNKKHFVLCFLSISGAGILLQILFYILQYFLAPKSVYALKYLAFGWIFYLSIVAIKNCQNTSYMKSILIYVLSGVPVVLISGLTGLAPFLLWLAS